MGTWVRWAGIIYNVTSVLSKYSTNETHEFILVVLYFSGVRRYVASKTCKGFMGVRGYVVWYQLSTVVPTPKKMKSCSYTLYNVAT